MYTYMNPFLYNGLYMSATVETFHLGTNSPNPFLTVSSGSCSKRWMVVIQ